ncbi:MAG: hypothetical protein WCP03_00275 [Candidatus Saccharibacteria bacterium]
MFGHNDDNHKDDDNQPVHDNGVVPMHDPMSTPEIIMAEPHNDSAHDDKTIDNLSEIPAVPVISSSSISDDHTDALPVLPKKNEPAVDKEDDTDLLDLKQKVLQDLSPLVGHLDQTPEEKFRTTMMMIQASDDKSLLPSAYESAQSIVDEKVKAQALLDVVNEINYFTQS